MCVHVKFYTQTNFGLAGLFLAFKNGQDHFWLTKFDLGGSIMLTRNGLVGLFFSQIIFFSVTARSTTEENNLKIGLCIG